MHREVERPISSSHSLVAHKTPNYHNHLAINLIGYHENEYFILHCVSLKYRYVNKFGLHKEIVINKQILYHNDTY